MVRSFKNIISDIEDFCTAHNQINGFGWGQLSNITTKDHEFVMLWLQPTSSSIDGHLMTLNFDMYVFDLLKQNKENLLDTINDTLLIGNDVISKFWDNEEEYEWTLNEEGVSCEPFEAKFDDFTSGWVFSIEIELENRLSLCSIPEDLEIPTPPVTDKYYIASDDDVYQFDPEATTGGHFRAVTEDVTESELQEFLIYCNLEIGDKIYVGASSTEATLVPEGEIFHEVTDKIEITGKDNYWNVKIDYPLFDTNNFEKVAKVTPFTSADYSDLIRGQQYVYNYLEFTGDLTGTYSPGDYIKITCVDDDNNVYYDMIDTITHKSGVTKLDTHMLRYVENLSSSIIMEKMTNIV